MKPKYRITPGPEGWRVQCRSCFSWRNVPNSGPFGYNGAWASPEWAIDMLVSLVWREARRIKPERRARRDTIMRIAKGPIYLPRDASV